MAKTNRTSTARSAHSGPRAGPLTRDQGRQFRTGVIEALRAMHDHKFHGTVRAFARQLIEQHGSQLPFDALGRVEGHLRRLERENVIRYDWGKSQAYEVVTTITLVDSEAVEPPKRRLGHIDRAKPAEQRRRRMEILAVLDHLGGSTESIRELAKVVIREYGDRHRAGTVITDTQSLGRARDIEKQNGRVHGRPTQRISITPFGRRGLARYRDAHNGEPKPPAPTDIGAAATPTAAPTGRPRVALSELSRTLLGEFALHAGAGMPLNDIIAAMQPLFRDTQPSKAFAQRIRFRCRDLSSSGYLERVGQGSYRITTAGIQKIGAANAPTPAPAAPNAAGPTASAAAPAPSTPATSPAATAEATPNGTPSDTVRTIDADIARVQDEGKRLDDQRAELEAQIAGIDRRSIEVTNRLGRLEHLRVAAVAAYADPPLAAGTAPEKR